MYRVIRQVKMIMLVCVYRVIRRRSYQVVCIQGHYVYRVIRQEKVMFVYRVIRYVEMILSVSVCTRPCVCTGSSDTWR